MQDFLNENEDLGKLSDSELRGKTEYFKNLANIIGASNAITLSWMKVDGKKMKIEITGLPKREEAEAGINEQLIVEYYSR